MEILPQELSWSLIDGAIQLSGLQSGKFYSLSCWNLLVPNKQPVEIKIPLVEKSSVITVIPLDLPAGIYHVQLFSPQKLPKNLGWWCGNNQYDIPEEANDNESLENYCYTVLGNHESVEDFIKAVITLDLDFNKQQIQILIQSLENNPYYFPNWLDPNPLLSKLEGLLDPLPGKDPPPTGTWYLVDIHSLKLLLKILMIIVEPKPPLSISTWYLVETRYNKRNLFLKRLEIAIEQNKLQSLILRREVPQDSIYENIVLLNISDLNKVHPHLQRIDCFSKLEAIPLTPEELKRMLGAK